MICEACEEQEATDEIHGVNLCAECMEECGRCAGCGGVFRLDDLQERTKPVIRGYSLGTILGDFCASC